MSLAQDNVSAGVATTASSISWTHTITAGLSNSGLIVGVAIGALGGPTITGVIWDQAGANEALSNTVNGSPATVVTSSGTERAYLWWKASPTAGTSKTILVNASASAELNAGAISLQGWSGGFNAASPQTNTVGANTNPTVTLTTTPTEWAIDCFGCENVIQPVFSATGALIFSTSIGTTNSSGGSQYKIGQLNSTSTVMNWTGVSLTTDAASVGIVLDPASTPVWCLKA